MIEKLHIIITLTAAAVVGMFSLIFFDSLFRTALNLVITIIVFFVIGLVVRNSLLKAFEAIKKENEEKERQEEAENDETDVIEDEQEAEEAIR